MLICSVPLTQPNRDKWINAIEKFQPFDYVIQTFHVCSRHFLPSDIKTIGKKTVISGRVPSIFTDSNDFNETNNEDVHNDVNTNIELNTNIQTLDFQHSDAIPFENETWYFATDDFNLTDDTNLDLSDHNTYDTISE